MSYPASLFCRRPCAADRRGQSRGVGVDLKRWVRAHAELSALPGRPAPMVPRLQKPIRRE